MSVTINAKGTSVPTFTIGKNGLELSQAGEITPPLANNLTVNLSEDNYLEVDAGIGGPALITTTDSQDLHINPAVGGGQNLILIANRWPTTDGTAGQSLTTNGAGLLSWTTVSGGGGGGTTMPPGTAAAPGLGFTSDAATGFFSPGLGELGISTAGIERMTITSVGNVEVGGSITTPATGKNISVFNDVNDPTAIANSTLIAESLFRNANVQLRFPNGWSGGYQWTDTAGVNRGQLSFNAADNSFVIQMATIDRIKISSEGNVTFTAPTTGVHIINGATSIVDPVDTTQSLSIQQTNSNGANIRLIGSGDITPKKYIRANSGSFQITNDAYTATIFNLTDDGTLTIPGNLIVAGTITGGGGGSTNTMPAGSAAAPGLAFVDDLDTGFFSPGPNLLSISTQGLERLRVFQDGMFTVTAPSIVADAFTINSVVGAPALVLIQGSPAGTSRMRFNTFGVRNWGLGSESGDKFSLRDETRAVDVLTITNTGRLGIESPNPQGRLHIVSDSLTTAVPIFIDDLRADGVDSISVWFHRVGVPVGSINTTSAGTVYNTVSDHRLKSNILDLTDSGTFIDKLRPRKWKWKSGELGVGFIADEIQLVSPGIVFGKKDAVDKDKKPIYQMMSYSAPELITNMIAELKALRQRVAELECKFK